MNKAIKVILKYTTIILSFLLMNENNANAQVDAQFTQYWAVPSYYNPAAIGRTDFVDVHAIARFQWVGIDGAPRSFSGVADMPFKFLDQRFGTGIVIHHENMGLYKTLNAAAQLAYKKRNLLKGELSVGVQLGILNETFKGSDVILPSGDEYHQGTDEAVPTTDITGTAFDINLGVFYTHKLFWVGVSATHLTAPTISLSEESSMEQYYEFKADRAFYLMGGGNIPIKNSLIELQPSFLVKMDSSFFSGEITARARYNKFLNGGIAYRWKDAVSVMVGAEYKNFTLGYSYDYPISKIAQASSGSHEVFLGYKMKLNLGEKNKNKHKSIRIM